MKAKIVLISLIGIIIVLSLVQIGVSNFLSTDGITLANMEDQITLLQKQNMALSEKVYSLSSLTTIASDAATLGFVDAKSEVLLTNPLPIALKQ